MPAEDLARLRAVVLADPELQRRLIAVPDRRDFVTSVVTLARERGLAVDAGDVEKALSESRRTWYATWI